MSYKISRYRIPDRSTRGSTNGDDDEREVDVKITQRKGSDRNEEYRKVVYEREVEREPPRRDVRTTRIVREISRSPSPPEYIREYRRESERERPEYLEKYIRSTEYVRDDDRQIQPIIIRERAPQPIIIREAARQPIIIREQVREREEQKYEMIESRSQNGRQQQDDNDDNRSVTTHRTQRSAAQKSRRQSSPSSESGQDQEEDYWYKKTTRQVARRPNNDYEAQYRREVDPRDSASNWGGNDERESRNDRRHSEEDYYYRRTEEYGDGGGRDDDQNHRKHLAEGAALGLGAAALLRHHQGKTGQATGGAGRLAGGAALGAIGAEAITRAANYNRENRSRSRGRGRREGRSRSRSRDEGPFSGNLAKFAGIAAIGALAGYAATRGKDNKFDLGNIQKSMGLGGGAAAANKARDGSGSRAGSPGALGANHEHATIVKAGLASAAIAGLVDRARSKSRPGMKRSRSRALLPAVGAGLGGAALAGLYERKKNEKAAKEAPRGRSATRSRSRTKSRSRRDRSSGGDQNLIQYGGDPIPPGEEYARARSRSRADSYYSQAGDRRRDGSGSSSDSDTSRRRRNRSRNRRRAESEARHDQEEHRFGPYAEPPPPPGSEPNLGAVNQAFATQQQQYYPQTNAFAPPPAQTYGSPLPNQQQNQTQTHYQQETHYQTGPGGAPTGPPVGGVTTATQSQWFPNGPPPAQPYPAQEGRGRGYNVSTEQRLDAGGLNNAASERYKPMTVNTTRRKSVSFDEGGDRVHEIQRGRDDDDEDDHEERRRGRSGP